MSNFAGKRPVFRRVLRIISDAFDDMFTVCLTITLILILIPLCLFYIGLYIYLPNNLAAPVTSIFGGVITIIVVPLVLYHIKRDHANKDRFYEQNKELYIEVSKILVEILIDISKEEQVDSVKDKQAESVKQLNNFLDKHYSEMCIFFPENLIWKLFMILREYEFEKYEYKNIAQLAEKSLNIIRKIGGLNEKIYINKSFIQIIRKNRNNS